MADSKDRGFLTTSEVAKLLSVSPDTVLKWVKAGKIKSRRTLGGHFRIPIDALNIPSRESDLDNGNSARLDNDFMYCWEYLAKGGGIKAECRDCITFRSRSRRCYELRDLPEGFGCLAMQCAAECVDCDYFKLVQGSIINVLILSRSIHFMRDAGSLDHENGLQVQFVRDEYEMASAIQAFRPDYVLIDCAIGRKRTMSLCTNLFNDARIPVTRIILASKNKNLSEYCDKEVFGWIRKPFSIEQLKNCIKSVPGTESSNNRSKR